MKIGIDLGGTKIEGIVLDDAGVTLARRRLPTPQGDAGRTISAIAKLVAALEADGRCAGAPVGVAAPGAPSPATGLLRNSNSTCLNGLPLRALLESALHRPVRVANDADCFALSEARDGAAADSGTVFGAILGTGVGGGIVIGGRLLQGRHGIAGEWGHLPLPWPRDDERPGPPCYCGRRGCIETFLSGPGFAADHERHGGALLAPRDILAAGGAAAAASLARYADRLARALTLVIDLIDPDVIVLGGGMSNVEALYETVPRLWQGWVFSDVLSTPLRAPLHGDSSGVRGAARLWDDAPP